MLMIPPEGGDTFAAVSGFEYASTNGASVEVGPGDVHQAFMRGWQQVSEPVAGTVIEEPPKKAAKKPVDE